MVCTSRFGKSLTLQLDPITQAENTYGVRSMPSKVFARLLGGLEGVSGLASRRSPSGVNAEDDWLVTDCCGPDTLSSMTKPVKTLGAPARKLAAASLIQTGSLLLRTEPYQHPPSTNRDDIQPIAVIEHSSKKSKRDDSVPTAGTGFFQGRKSRSTAFEIFACPARCAR